MAKLINVNTASDDSRTGLVDAEMVEVSEWKQWAMDTKLENAVIKAIQMPFSALWQWGESEAGNEILVINPQGSDKCRGANAWAVDGALLSLAFNTWQTLQPTYHIRRVNGKPMPIVSSHRLELVKSADERQYWLVQDLVGGTHVSAGITRYHRHWMRVQNKHAMINAIVDAVAMGVRIHQYLPASAKEDFCRKIEQYMQASVWECFQNHCADWNSSNTAQKLNNAVRKANIKLPDGPILIGTIDLKTITEPVVVTCKTRTGLTRKEIKPGDELALQWVVYNKEDGATELKIA